MLFNVDKPDVTRDGTTDSRWYTQKKKEADTKAFIDIVKQLDIDIGKQPEKRIVDIVRLGDEKKFPLKKGRPLRVTLSDLDTKRQILANAKLLRETRYI